MKEIKTLSVIDGKSLLGLDVEPPKFIIAGLMPVGLHILSGSAKIGKSWLSLWLCQQVSTGGKVWEFETRKCGTLYLALEDTIDRLHFRLSHITDDGSEQSYFATEADNLSGSLIPQLETFMAAYPDTGLVVVDTLQRVRGAVNDKNAYANDYDEIGRIKSFADRFKIAVLLIHHVRKMPDSDPFNMVSGSVGIIGAVDSMYVLEKDKRTANKATLHVTGRDIEDMQLLLEFDRDMTVWRFVSYLSGEPTADTLTPVLVKFLSSKKTFSGTATELLDSLKGIDSSVSCYPKNSTISVWASPGQRAPALFPSLWVTMTIKIYIWVRKGYRHLRRVTIPPKQGYIDKYRHRHQTGGNRGHMLRNRGLKSACLQAFPAPFPCPAGFYTNCP